MPLTVVRTVEPVIESIALDDVKAFLQVTTNVDDTLLSDIIFHTTDYLESVIHRQFLTATYRFSLDAFPWDPSWSTQQGLMQWTRFPRTLIEIPRPPLQSITSIKYQNINNVETTFATTEYGVDADSEPGRVYLLPGHSWPSTYAIPNAVKIIYLAGWTSVDAMPARLRSLLLFVIGDLYHYRRGTSVEDFIQEVPYVKRLIRSLNFGDVF